ncbi:GSU2403 family nucleotidyltransferase fold protein [Leucobacter celer]|uniref:GSU2403 family nucleotidyltransferase fold protein n=1 Tax=Leucobacter celer TaxID=668625 RepID=UPI0006A7D90F|nr:GSU2403 family nucleotidyltransferase fold protein [Leucobacter celer]
MTDAVSLARRGLLDAIEALQDHLDAIILVGAQAIYLHAGEADVALAAYTTDGDLVIDPTILGTDPLIEDALKSGGFEPLKNKDGQRVVGSWITDFDVAVDLMVPTEVAGPGKKTSRGVEAPPHDRYAMRRTHGLEGAIVDYYVKTITSLEPNDSRSFEVKVAGPAALLVAKLHKINDRLEQPQNRRDDKDAHDVYRLLRTIETATLADTLQRLLTTPVTKAVTTEAVGMLRELFGSSSAQGSLMAGRSEEGVGDPEQVSLAASFLATDLLAALADQSA